MLILFDRGKLSFEDAYKSLKKRYCISKFQYDCKQRIKVYIIVQSFFRITLICLIQIFDREQRSKTDIA